MLIAFPTHNYTGVFESEGYVLGKEQERSWKGTRLCTQMLPIGKPESESSVRNGTWQQLMAKKNVFADFVSDQLSKRVVVSIGHHFIFHPMQLMTNFGTDSPKCRTEVSPR